MTDDERAIRDLVETWMTATRAGDVHTVLDLMTHDAVFMTPGNPPFGKADPSSGVVALTYSQRTVR